MKDDSNLIYAAGSFSPLNHTPPSDEQMERIRFLDARLAEKGLPHHKEYHPANYTEAQHLLSIMYRRLHGKTDLEEEDK